MEDDRAASEGPGTRDGSAGREGGDASAGSGKSGGDAPGGRPGSGASAERGQGGAAGSGSSARRGGEGRSRSEAAGDAASDASAREDEDAGRARGARERGERTWSETLHGVQEAVGDMVGEVLDGVRDVAVGRRFPRVDVVRLEGEGYRVFVDLPGVQKEDLEVTTLGGELTVAGRRLPEEIPEEADVLRSERGHGSFRRSVRLPADARTEDVRATLEDGVLVVRVPLAEPGDARRVEID